MHHPIVDKRPSTKPRRPIAPIGVAGERRDGKSLARRWGVQVAHALYRSEGTWYHVLRRFPAAYFDDHGYIRFESRETYLQCAGIALSNKPGKDWASIPDGIASLPGYVHVGEQIDVNGDGQRHSFPEVERAGDADAAVQDEVVVAFEGEMREQLVRHRARERSLRDAKVRRVLKCTGCLRCEVPGCGFDFEREFGALGKGYAQVHHLEPLGAREGKSGTTLDALAIVCANCHVMIHLGGACRTLDEIAARRADARRANTVRATFDR